MNNNPVVKKINQLPRMVRLITGNYDAWIIGSAADPLNDKPKDYDIGVSFSDWPKVALLIPKDAKPNLFGGWKFISDKKSIDVWPTEIVNHFLCSKCEWMWQPQHNIRIMKTREKMPGWNFS